MRAVSLHRDVIVVTSALLQVNCVIVRGGVGEDARAAEGEVFVIDSPVLPDELDALPALLEQAHFPAPSGLLATHGDWDHVLGPLAFPGVPLGCTESTAERLQASPGEAQRELRSFDEELMIERARPLALGAVQALPVPGRCEIGDAELELYPAGGHTVDGMAVMIGWASMLVAGDYLSAIEIPTLNDGGAIQEYVDTLERIRPLAARCTYVVPGHGPVMDSARALAVLKDDLAYLHALREVGAQADLPEDRRTKYNRRMHARNAAMQG